MNVLLERIKQIFKIGLFHILGAYSINQIIAFVTNIIVVHFLTKVEYGYYGSAINIYSIFLLFTGLGILSGQLLFCSEERADNEKRAIYKYTFMAGIVVDIFLCLLMLIYGWLAPVGMEATRKYIVMLSALPLADFFMQYVLVFYRTQCDNKGYSYLQVAHSIFLLFFTSIGAVIAGVRGIILGQYFSYIFVAIVGIYIRKDKFKSILIRDKADFKLKKSLWIYSLKNGACSALNQILYLLDVTLISNIIANPEMVASYKLATLIPNGLKFIPSSIAIALIPHYAKNMSNKKWLRKVTRNVFWASFFFNGAITIILYFGASIIITLLWGEQYIESVVYFRILILSYFFLATFRMFCTNILAVFRKTNFNLIVAILTGVLNIVLDYVLIIKYSAIGAAWATVISVVFASILSFPYLIKEIYIDKK